MVLTRRPFFTILTLLSSVIWIGSLPQDVPQWDRQTPVDEVLAYLGDTLPSHILNMDQRESYELIEKGKEIVFEGRTIGPNGKRSRYVSKYYACTSCHNTVQEDPDLQSRAPEPRLAYAIDHGLPFLQGTTFHGIVNRESWYNDDYVKKYGEKMKLAHDDLREAIQLCAIECAQGRPMEDWEINAVLAYYWSISFKLGNLDISAKEMKRLIYGANNPAQRPELIQWLKTKYLLTSPATFSDAPPDKRKGYDLEGDPQKGKAIYELSCLYCHKEGGVSSYILDSSKLSFQHLFKKIPKDSHFSLYQIIRYGTYALPGHRPYMPHYPLERMSNQQVEDLRAYIELKVQ